MPYGIGRSLPVITAKTPGSASAFETSMFLINACGTCERSILQNNIRGSTMSSANFVWPTHFARASTLRNGFPTTLRFLSTDYTDRFNQVRRRFLSAVRTLHHAYAPQLTQLPRKS